MQGQCQRLRILVSLIEIPEVLAKKLVGRNRVILGIRGEDIKFDPANLEVYAGNEQTAIINNTEIMGNENNLYFEFGGETTVARVTKYDISEVVEEVRFVFMSHKLHFFDIDTEEVIN